jgi:hypothetical protein
MVNLLINCPVAKSKTCLGAVIAHKPFWWVLGPCAEHTEKGPVNKSSQFGRRPPAVCSLLALDDDPAAGGFP